MGSESTSRTLVFGIIIRWLDDTSHVLPPRLKFNPRPRIGWRAGLRYFFNCAMGLNVTHQRVFNRHIYSLLAVNSVKLPECTN